MSKLVQLALPLRWHELPASCWRNYSADETASRPTEDAAFENIRKEARGGQQGRVRVRLSQLEREVYDLERRCLRDYPHFARQHDRARWIATQLPGGLMPWQIVAILDDISYVTRAWVDYLENKRLAAGVPPDLYQEVLAEEYARARARAQAA